MFSKSYHVTCFTPVAITVFEKTEMKITSTANCHSMLCFCVVYQVRATGQVQTTMHIAEVTSDAYKVLLSETKTGTSCACSYLACVIFQIFAFRTITTLQVVILDLQSVESHRAMQMTSVVTQCIRTQGNNGENANMNACLRYHHTPSSTADSEQEGCK